MAGQLYERSRSERPDEDPDAAFKDRGVKLATTFGGAGVLHGDLTAECAEIVGRVLDALGAKAGKDDDRSRDRSGTTTRWPRRCAGWSRPGCCRSGPGSR